MAWADDFTIDYANKRIYHSSGTTRYNVNDMYSALMDDFDDSTEMDDLVPMTAQVQGQAYTLVNGWYMDDASFPYLKTGAITTSGWLNEIHVIVFQSGGYVNAIAGDIGKMVNDDGTDFGTLLAYNNTTRKWWIRTGSATTMASGSVVTIDSGTGGGTTSAISVTGENLWANAYTLGTIEAGTSIYVEQNGSILTDWASVYTDGHVDFLIKTKEMGTEIDSGIVTFFAREFGDLYDHSEVDLTAGGRTPVVINTAPDLNNTSAVGDVEDMQDGTTATIAVAFGTYASDESGDGNNENYEVQIDCDGQRLTDVYEVCKYWTREGSSTSLDGVTGNLYRYADAAYAEKKQSPLGTFAGGKFFGARGVYLINLHASDIQAFELIDSDGNTVTPPNQQALSVTGVVSGDSVAVYLDDGAGAVDKDTYASHASSNAAGDNTFVITASIPNDTPDTGKIVVVAVDEDEEHHYRYASWTGSTFTFPTAASGTATGGDTDTLVDSGATFQTADVEVGDIVYDSTNTEYAYVVSVDSETQLTTTAKATSWSGAAYETNALVQTYDASDTVYAPYILTTATSTSVTVTLTYVSDRNVIIRVRKKGIIPFENTGTFGSTGLSVSAIRQTDTIVT